MRPATESSAARLDASRHLDEELLALMERLRSHLARLRGSGRSTLGDAVGGMVIEDGEAEALLGATCDALRERQPSPAGRGVAEAARREDEELRAVALGAFLPLVHARRAFDLGRVEYEALLLALAVELLPRCGRVIAYLNDHVGRTRPTLGLAWTLCAADVDARPAGALADLLQRPLFQDGLLELEGDGPLPGRALALAPELAARLARADAPEAVLVGVRVDPPPALDLERLVLGGAARARLAQWAEPLRRREVPPPLLLLGAPGSGRSTAARAALAASGVPLVTASIDPADGPRRLRIARREARWYGAALLLELPDGPLGAAEALALGTILRGAARPIICTSSADSAPDLTALLGGREPFVVRIEEPGFGERARLWQALLPRGVELPLEELEPLAAQFPFGPGRMARAVLRAEVEWRLRPAEERAPLAVDLARACRDLGAAAMGPLAQKLPASYARADLVVPPAVAAELDLAVAWMRQRRTVLDDWGFARRVALGRGLNVLFSGPPGTGKTMAAQVLARELGVDLYRVDLSRVMSKWIGETEKNLGRLFDECRASGAVLFFDEADALFGKRTEVKDAHDRYANVEIGYLLHRMEEHDGLVVLATNRMGDMDEALPRRFPVVAHFPMPGPEDRLRLWRGMLPPGAPCAAALDLPRLAAKFALSGGEIRNIVLAAAFLAADEGTEIAMRHLLRGLQRELVKSGKVVDLADLAPGVDGAGPGARPQKP